MIEKIANLNVANTARVVAKLSEMMQGRAVANLMTSNCLAKPKSNLKGLDMPPIHEAETESCIWCLEAVVAVAVEPQGLKWQHEPDGTTVLKYADPGGHLMGPGWETSMDFMPTDWWVANFGVEPIHLTPPETYQEPFWSALVEWRPKERMKQLGRDVRLWEINDCIGPIAWEWTRNHFRHLRDLHLSGGRT